jgi:hypothetical protein
MDYSNGRGSSPCFRGENRLPPLSSRGERVNNSAGEEVSNPAGEGEGNNLSEGGRVKSPTGEESWRREIELTSLNWRL